MLQWYSRVRARAAVKTGRRAARTDAWSKAAAYYRTALRFDPESMRIWVQLGHALKELGDYSAAEEAYRRALALDGGVADSYLQLGHLMKLQHRYTYAVGAYATAAQLAPNLEQAHRELLSLVGYSPADMRRALNLPRARIEKHRADNEWLPDTEQAPLSWAIADEKHGNYDVIWFGPIDWNFRIQRPQHLAMQLADNGARVFYISTVFEPANRDRRFRIIDRPHPGVMEIRLGIDGDPFESVHMGLSAPGIAELQRSLAALTADAAISAPIVIVQHPGWSLLALLLSGAKVVYDCIDLAIGFPDAPPTLAEAEAALIAGADLITTASRPLAEHIAPRTSVVIRNGVEFDLFSEAYSERPHGPQPVIGYFGAISEWFDMELVETCANARLDWEFRLIGRPDGPHAARVGKVRNIRFYGELPYREIPKQLRYFDVAIIPFKMIDLIKHTNPVKLYEYMAAGKAVVSAPLPEVVTATNLVYIGCDAASFVQRINQAMAEDTLYLRAQRRAWAHHHSWANRAVQLQAAIDATVANAGNVKVERSCF